MPNGAFFVVKAIEFAEKMIFFYKSVAYIKKKQ